MVLQYSLVLAMSLTLALADGSSQQADAVKVRVEAELMALQCPLAMGVLLGSHLQTILGASSSVSDTQVPLLKDLFTLGQSLFIPLILFLFIFNVSERRKMNILILLKTFLNFSSPVYLV